MPNELPAHRRRRRAEGSAQAAPTPSADPDAASIDTGASIDPAAASVDAGGKRRERTSQRKGERKGERKPGRSSEHGRDAGERGLRDIVGAGRSQLGVSGALRARDVNRPTEADLAEAEATVEIIRRQWTPPTDSALPAGRTHRR